MVPLRIDCLERLENLRASTASLRRGFPESQIIVVEMDQASRIPSDLLKQFELEHFHVGADGPFSKSVATNAGIAAARNSVVCIFDADVLILAWQIEKAADWIRRNAWPVVLPYNTVCVDVGGALRRRILETGGSSSVPTFALLARKTTVKDLFIRREGMAGLCCSIVES